ncbi:hypothetical protein KQI49_00595 [Virgibacillus sp. MSJ-26]|uniref:hypothetical protein n=1 Tax=Virgibacillus sp. MSJ-26 TaxID=2841522 RepID=UPI001C1001F7|nr:hypothetical protein [Virgibacillus sp. MSJ-26]MBU5465325.1 hypothetical protein [Virgibacillus sp. MSJ-26]
MKKLLVAISLIIIIISGCSMTADNNKDMEAAKQESTSVEKNTSEIDSVEDSLLSPDRILNIAHRGLKSNSRVLESNSRGPKSNSRGPKSNSRVLESNSRGVAAHSVDVVL